MVRRRLYGATGRAGQRGQLDSDVMVADAEGGEIMVEDVSDAVAMVAFLKTDRRSMLPLSAFCIKRPVVGSAFVVEALGLVVKENADSQKGQSPTRISKAVAEILSLHMECCEK
mmetsp:Transcript_40693/g.85491  ORF Transcript_40693/g.85491 Transcript_40693/m.85491 type:complete len:114 (+) Transcript_40693:1370-1711(+)